MNEREKQAQRYGLEDIFKQIEAATKEVESWTPERRADANATLIMINADVKKSFELLHERFNGY